MFFIQKVDYFMFNVLWKFTVCEVYETQVILMESLSLFTSDMPFVNNN
jgi:hypothetical protein